MMSEVDELRRQVAALEHENARLRDPDGTPRGGGRGRTVVAVLLLTLGLLLAPAATIASWARVQLVDTDQFVATFAPLAEDPAVQAFVADEVAAAINAQVDVEGVVGEVFDGVAAIGLPPRAEVALGLLEAPAAQGIRSLIDTVSEQVVTSPMFADVWAGALRLGHERAVALIQGDPGAVLQLSEDGTLSVQLGVVIAQVKAELADRGVGIADMIPEIDRQIPIVQADSLVVMRTAYTAAVAVGYWLPWVAIGLLVAGVAVARRPLRALTWTSALFAVSFVLLAAGFWVGRLLFIGSVSPSVMPESAAESLFRQLTTLAHSTAVALAVLGALVAAGSWLAGSTRPARALRDLGNRGADALRAAGERHGVTTGRFGALVDRWRSGILVLVAAVGALLIFVSRPPTVGVVVGVVIGVAVVFVLVELVRRPASTAPTAHAADERP